MADARDILGALAAQDEYSQPPDEAVFGRYPAPRTAVQYPAGSDTDGGGVNPAADFIRSVPRGMLGGLMGAATAGGEAEAHAMSQPDLAANIPSRDQAREAIEANVTGDLYRPQTRAGRYGETTGEVLGNPANWMAPGRLGAIAGWNVASGLGSEAAGQATEGTPYEKAARIAGSFGPMAAERALALAPGALAKIPGAFETAFNAVVPQNAAGAIIGGRLPSAKPPRIGDVADLSGLSTPGVTVGRPQPQGHRAANESIGPEGPTALDLARQEGYGGGEFTGSGKRGAAYLDDLIARLREDRGVPRVSEVPTLDRGPGQAPEAIRRTVDYRDPSGRPVRTAPLPIGTEEAILEQGFGMATGARPPGPHPPLMQAAERKGPRKPRMGDTAKQDDYRRD